MADSTINLIKQIQLPPVGQQAAVSYDIAAKYNISSKNQNEEIDKTYLRLDGGTMTGSLYLENNTSNSVRMTITSKNPYIGFVNLDEPEDKRISWYVQAHKPAGGEAAFYIGPTISKAIKIDENGNLSSVGTITASGGFKGTAAKATADANGANIASTYLKKADIDSECALTLTDTDINNLSKPFIKKIDVGARTITVIRGELSDLGLTTVYIYRGSKTWSELMNLPSAKIGDVYHVSSGAPDGKGSSNWACYTTFSSKINSTNYKNYWQPLGGIVDLSGYALLSPDAFQWFDGEQRMKNSTYCPTMLDIASGVGCSLKNTRALDNQAIIGELILPYTTQTSTDANECNVTAGEMGVYLLKDTEGSPAVESGKIKHKTQIGKFSSKGWVGDVTGDVTGNVTGNADSATQVVDYGNTTRRISIGFATSALKKDEISHIAGYTENGTKIKDVGQATLQDWLSCVVHKENRVDLISSNNEFNFIPDDYGGENGFPIYINYKTYSGETKGKVNAYHFNTGNGQTDSYADIYGKTFHGKLNGNAATATNAEGANRLALYKTSAPSGETLETLDSTWGGAVEGISRIVWRQAWKCPKISEGVGIGTDTGDMVLGLRPSEYAINGTELCMMIDGDYYSMGNKVLHAGNYSSYVNKMTELSGNSATTSKLKTAVTIQTDLTSTAAASFDGSGSVSVGVSGTLPLASGGTGTSLTKNANAIIRFSGSGNYFSQTRTGDGAFYATAQDGSPQFGTLPIAQGGTGKTNATDAANNFLNSLTTGVSDPVGTDWFISQYAGGSQTTFHRRPVSKLWNYIKTEADKIYVKLGGSDNITGNLISTAGIQATRLSLGDNKKTEKAYYEYSTNEDCVMLVFN